MNIFIDNIDKITKENSNFRKVIFTGQHCQLVLMSLKPKEEIGLEVHNTVDQFFRVESGIAVFEVDNIKHTAQKDFAVIIPAGTLHNVTNISADEDLKLYTLYSPANHKDGTVHKTLKDAQEAEHD